MEDSIHALSMSAYFIFSIDLDNMVRIISFGAADFTMCLLALKSLAGLENSKMVTMVQINDNHTFIHGCGKIEVERP